MNKEDTQRIIELVNEDKIKEADEIIKRYYPNGFVAGCATEFSICKDKGTSVEELYWVQGSDFYKSSITHQTY